MVKPSFILGMSMLLGLSSACSDGKKGDTAAPASASAVGAPKPPPRNESPTSDLTVTPAGAYPAALAWKQVGGKHEAFAACYEEAKKRNADAEGTAIVRFALSKDGKRGPLRVAGTLKDDAFQACIEKAAEPVELPSPEDGKDVEIAVPFYFSDDTPQGFAAPLAFKEDIAGRRLAAKKCLDEHQKPPFPEVHVFVAKHPSGRIEYLGSTPAHLTEAAQECLAEELPKFGYAKSPAIAVDTFRVPSS